MLDSKYNKTVAVVQARMNSTRLPGKVMREFGNGLTMLDVLFQRLKAAKTIDAVVVTFPWQPAENDIIGKAALKNDVFTYRGSDEDVLDRMFKAAVTKHAGTVIRVCADNPLTDPEVIDRCVQTFRELNVEYLMPAGLPPGTFGEVMTMSALERAWNEATSPEDREHVTTFIRAHPEIFKQYLLQWEPAQWLYPRLTVDTEADFRLLDALVTRAGDPLRISINNLKRP